MNKRLTENDVLFFSNDGVKLADTNYWNTEGAKRGYLFLTWNVDHARLLVPKHHQELVECELSKGVKYVIISTGRYKSNPSVKGIEILFEDHTLNTFNIILQNEQCDRKIELPEDLIFNISVWFDLSGPKFEYKGRHRKVEYIPCLQPWVKF